MQQIIDFVIPWVDGNDPEWQAERAKYQLQKEGGDTRECKYRDMKLMRYWFRAVEKFAPWVNKIHFVTCGHYPKWLDLSHPKLNFVKHSDYMPQECLPTFNSNAIELNFHKIKNLSENFVLFNDDMFILKKLKPSDFFQKDIPCDQALLRSITPTIDDLKFVRHLYNNIAVINKHFKKHIVIKKHLFKWFNLNYGIFSNYVNFLNFRQIRFSGMHDPHLPIAYKKSEFEFVWQIENDLLRQTTSHQFRDEADVSDWLVRYFRVMKGEFKPYPVLGKNFVIENNSVEGICNDIKKQAYKMICINDTDIENDEFEILVQKISNAFEIILPEKSEFEKSFFEEKNNV